MSAGHEHAGAISARQQARRVILAAAGAVALVACGAPVARAATLTFGANLNNPANVPNNDTTNGVCSAAAASPMYQSCMWTYTGYDKYDLDGLGAPATGTVTAIRVKIGAVTGKMRVNVIRFNNQGGSVSGPFLQAYGPEFTPNPNSITQVPTSLRVQSDDYVPPGDPTIRSIDQLALEVEAPNVPVPLFSDPPAANNPLTGAANTYGTYPGPTEQRIEAPSYNAIPGTFQYHDPNGGISSNLGVLMSADLTTGGPPGAGSGPGPNPSSGPGLTPNRPRPVAGAPAVRLAGAGRVKKGTATIPVQCLVVDCSGLISLQNGAGVARATPAKKNKPRKSKLQTYGSASFTAKVGTTIQVKIKLNKAGRALLAHHHTATVYAKVSFTAGGGISKSFRITLKR